MKAIKLIVKNIGIVADATIELNKPLIIFYGEIRQGKTTLLNAVKWVFGGSFPTDIIRTGESEASITLALDCGTIHRSFYRAKSGEVKARAIVFEKNGAPVKDAVAEIKKLLNPFLLDQNHLIEMSELERKKYFVSQFSVNTEDLDKQIAHSELLATETRSKLRGYGDIDLTVVAEPPVVHVLRAQKDDLIQDHERKLNVLRGEVAARRRAYQEEVNNTTLANKEAVERSHHIREAQKRLAEYTASVLEHERCLVSARDGVASYAKWLQEHPLIPEQPAPAALDLFVLEGGLSVRCNTDAIDLAISQAEAQAVRYAHYQGNLKRQQARAADEAAIKHLEAATRELRTKRIARLKTVSRESGIPGLEFDEAGNFSYEGTQAGMLSTSQLMKLSSQLSALYPEGFGLDLIDRAESLGKSIFAFVDRAKAENKTILAAVVGERPAEIPEEIGVFVVENGVVK